MARAIAPTMALLTAVFARGEGRALPSTESAASYKALRSASGRLSVVGRHSGENLMLSRWVEDVMARLERLAGYELPFDRARPFSVLALDSIRDQAPTNAPSPCAGIEADIPGRRIVVRGPLFPVDFNRAAALCGVFVDAWILEAGDNPPREAVEPSESLARERTPAPAPRWLIRGFTHALYKDERTERMNELLTLWRTGSLPTLPAFLEDPAAHGDAAGDCVGTGVVLWIEGLPARAEAFRALWRILARGEAPDISGWAGLLAAEPSTTGLDAAWDEWVLGQSRAVRVPGMTKSVDVGRLFAGLLIFPGEYGMPFGTSPYRPVPWSALIERRRENWVRDFCRRKSAALRLLGAGRGPGPERVVDAYGDFLNALAAGRGGGRLRELLAEAETARSKLIELWPEAY